MPVARSACDRAARGRQGRHCRSISPAPKTEELRRKFLAQGAEPVGNTPQDMASFLERERALWGGVIEKAGLKAPE